jgi:uncharacterized protein (TIGR01777 family)
VRVFVTGATGFVGSALVARLIQAGHAVVASSRNPVQARATLGPAATVVATTDDVQALAHALEGCGAVVNLAGEPVAGRRWTPAVAAAIHDSRAGATRRIVQAMACLAAPPSVLVSASAVGIYGDRGDERLDSSSRAGSSPLARVVLDWEEAALGARALGARVALLRLGVVLGAGGGLLDGMLPALRVGLGGRLGSGRQWVPWVHLDDVIAVVLRTLDEPAIRGPIDLVSPEPVRQAELVRRMARRLRRPAIMPAPAGLLRLVLGDGAAVLLDSARVEPVGLMALGHRFRFPTLDEALADSLGVQP